MSGIYYVIFIVLGIFMFIVLIPLKPWYITRGILSVLLMIMFAALYAVEGGWWNIILTGIWLLNIFLNFGAATASRMAEKQHRE